jgi:RNA polymerase sigma-70 factor (ECF subfamily)
MTPAEDLGRLIKDVAARQDRAAFARLFEHFAPRLKGYLMRSGASSDLAEEIAQETLAAVWRKAASFDPARGGASTWVFTIARNLRIDHARRRRAPDAFEPDPTEESAPPPQSDDVMIAAERDARVQKALAALSPEQAAIVKLSFFVEKPHPEIARELGIPLGTVKSRVRLALKRLRALLEDLP